MRVICVPHGVSFKTFNMSETIPCWFIYSFFVSLQSYCCIFTVLPDWKKVTNPLNKMAVPTYLNLIFLEEELIKKEGFIPLC